MADIFTKEKRSDVMSRIRGKNTKPELIVFRYLRKEGVYFQKHYRRTHGSPDVALPRKKKAVFIDGGYWHGWKWHERKPKTKQQYWIDKIENNMRRDRRNRRKLRAEGWQVMRVWDHQLATIARRERTLRKIKEFLVEEMKETGANKRSNR